MPINVHGNSYPTSTITVHAVSTPNNVTISSQKVQNQDIQTSPLYGPAGPKGDKGDRGEDGKPCVYVGVDEPTEENYKIWLIPSGSRSKISDLVDDTDDNPIQRANTLTGLISSVSELNFVDGVTSAIQEQINNKQATISDLETIREGATAGATALQPNDNITQLTNNAGYITSSALSGYATETWVGNQGYITGIDSNDVTNALGYTPYDSDNPNGYTSNVGTVTKVNNTTPDASGNVSLTIPSINSSNNYVPYKSGTSSFGNSTLMYNSNAMAFTGKLHVGSSSPGSYYNKGKFTIYDNTPSQQVTSMALLNYGGGGGCGVAIDMYNTSANGGIPSGRFGVVDNGNYSGYLQLQVKKSGAQSNPLLPAMNIVPVPATNSLTTCVSFGQDEFNRVLFDLHKPEATVTITDSDKRWGGSGTTYQVTGSNKFNPRLLVAVGDIVSFDSFTTEATVTGVVSNSSTCQITVNQTLGTISNKNISVKKAYFKITDENNNIKVYVDPYGKFGIGTGTPAYNLDVAGTINASTDVKINGNTINPKSFTGFDSTKTQTLKNINGTLTWVDD